MKIFSCRVTVNTFLALTLLFLVSFSTHATESPMPPVAMGEVAAGILGGGGPNVSGFLKETSDKDPKERGRKFAFKVDGSGKPVKWDSPDQKFTVDLEVYYYTDGTYGCSISVTYISTGEILNVGGSGELMVDPSEEPAGDPVPLPRSANDAIKQAFERLNRGRRDGRVLLRMPGIQQGR